MKMALSKKNESQQVVGQGHPLWFENLRKGHQLPILLFKGHFFFWDTVYKMISVE